MIDTFIKLNAYFVLGIVLFFWGFLWFILNFRRMLLGNTSKSWNIIKGRILQSELYVSDKGESYSYKPQIEYTYTIDGVEYKSNRVYFGSNVLSSNKDSYQMLIKKYPVGKTVDVYYNSMNNKTSVLEPGIKSDVIIRFVFYAVLLALGFIFYSRPEMISNFFHNL